MSEPDAPLDPRLAAAFATRQVHLETAALSARVLEAARPELHLRAAFWPRLARVLGLSLVPLPLLIAANATVVAWLYGVAAAWLPNGVALYIAGSYAVAAMVGLGLSYATIPLLLARRPPDDDALAA